ncbi:MAG: NUDIX hydrolase [Nitrospira sp.]|nr:NUDIX hydrolase [Nitrospira sp.]
MVKNIFKGRVLTLNLETIPLPNGSHIELEIIRHPGAAAMVPMKDDGTVVLIKQYRHAAGGFIYEIPAGKLHPGEDPKDCALRELEEEVGYKAAKLDLLSSLLTAPGFADEVIHIYLATGLTVGKQQLDHDEVLDVVEMPLDKALAMITDGTIRDAKTIVGVQMVYLRGRSKASKK